jgi:hypothetical protein
MPIQQGMSQQTPAAQHMIRRVMSSGLSAGRRRRKSGKKRSAATSRKAKSGGRKLKFGSPAWQKKYNKRGKAKRKK